MKINNLTSPWVESFPAEIIVCDPLGTIIEMNEIAIQLYAQDGGAALIGRNLSDHHQEPARSQVRKLVERRETVIYTTEKAGEKKLVCIAPWMQDGRYAGFALLTLNLPADLPNICKD